MDINLTKEMVLRYLGYKGQDISYIGDITNETISEVRKIVSPKFLIDYQQISTSNNNSIELKNGLILNGNAISKRLYNCQKAGIILATIGIAFDKRLFSLQHTQPTKSIIFDATGSAYIEAIVDKLNTQIKNDNPDYDITKRFSAGFGDLPLITNKHIIEIYDASRRLGITINNAFLMSPTKSVTAIIGIRNK